MRLLDNNTQAFFALVRAGLWETEVELLPFGNIDFRVVYRLAEEQSVVGLVAAGIEHVSDIKVPKEVVLQFVGQTLQIEQHNTTMNSFLGVLVERMRLAGIYTLLVKGQGVAQCYERPLWRSCGDVDFFLSEDNYIKAKRFLIPLASSTEPEDLYEKHLGLTIDPWVVELHGSLRNGLSNRMDRVLDLILKDTFLGGKVRSWMNGSVQVFLLSEENDILFVFTHMLKHFYRGGLGLRQVCDWCRLLWTYKDSLNTKLLFERIKSMRLETEWTAFGAFAIWYIGMPEEFMPFSSNDKKWERKARLICDFVLEVGNFGHNRDSSYFKKYPYVIRKFYSFLRRCKDFLRHAILFPLDSIRFFPSVMFHGLQSAVRGE